MLKDAGNLLKSLDPYDHPRTSMAEGSSAALAPDQWTTMLSYGTADPNVGAVEHQFYLCPGREHRASIPSRISGMRP